MAEKIRIIVAEDNKVIRSIVQTYFTRKGLAVDACENGEQALEKMAKMAQAKASYDAVLTDNDMHSLLDGVGLIRIIRQKYGNNFPIWLMSALDIEDSYRLRRNALEAGATGYISKPFRDLTDLDEVIRSLQPSQEDSQSDSKQ